MVTEKKKKGKEIKLKTNNEEFRCLFGVTDIEKPSVIYVNIFTWCRHLDFIENYQENIKLLSRKLKNDLKLNILEGDVFDIETIFSLNSKKTNLSNNDIPFHFALEIIMRVKKETTGDLLDINDDVLSVVESLCLKLESEKNFEFKLKKPKINS